jgi:hypothetical protein
VPIEGANGRAGTADNPLVQIQEGGSPASQNAAGVAALPAFTAIVAVSVPPVPAAALETASLPGKLRLSPSDRLLDQVRVQPACPGTPAGAESSGPAFSLPRPD